MRHLLVVLLLGLSGCMATIGTPNGIREHYRGRNGGLSIAKQKNEQTLQVDKGYWATEMERIKKWGTSYADKWQNNEETGS